MSPSITATKPSSSPVTPFLHRDQLLDLLFAHVVGADRTPEPRAARAVDALLAILDELRDSSGGEPAQRDPEPIDFDLRRTLADALGPLVVWANLKGLELNHQVGSEVPDRLSGDPQRLRQVLVYLAGHAVHGTHRGEVVVSIDLEPSSEPLAREVVLHGRIHDLGHPGEEPPLAFEADTRESGSRSGKGGVPGSGLGVARRLIERMGGRSWVETNPGRGSTFHFTVPASPVQGTNRAGTTTATCPAVHVGTDWHLVPAVADVSPAGILPRTQAETWNGVAHSRVEPIRPIERFPIIHTVAGSPGGDRREPVRQRREGRTSPKAPGPFALEILLVEDSPVDRTVALRLLEKWGYTVVAAGDGQEALTLLEERSFDLVLMDIVMPVLDGFEAIAAIRRHEEASGKHLPAIALTGSSQRGDRERCLRSGFDDFVFKPVNGELLLEAIGRLFANAPRRSGTS